MLAATGQTLKDWVQAHPEALGDAVLKRFGTDLPFLFKARHGALSAGTVHPMDGKMVSTGADAASQEAGARCVHPQTYDGLASLGCQPCSSFGDKPCPVLTC